MKKGKIKWLVYNRRKPKYKPRWFKTEKKALIFSIRTKRKNLAIRKARVR